MNESEFRKKITEEKIPPYLYSLNQLKEDALCLRKVHNRWEVFYFERGREFDLKEFCTENEAYSYLYYKLKVLHACHLENGI